MDKRIMDWEICEKEHINKVRVDKEKINSILKMSDILLKVTKQIKKDEETVSIITGNYYEIIKELLTALLLKHGMKSDNHECRISFFKKHYPNYDYEANLIHELKNIRNRIYYDGIFVKKSYLDKNELEFNHIIELLIKLIKNEKS
ncbi:MAG: hypothetical protein AABX45_02170 [Nanoarchaeota archaeon]